MKRKICKGLWALLVMAVLFLMSGTVKSNVNVVPTATVHAEERSENQDPVSRCNMIDISSANGYLDFDEIAQRMKRVCIRCGYGSDIESQDDSMFLHNVAECESRGIPYDIYLYSYALNKNPDDKYDELKSEIEHAKRLAAECNPEYVWLDMEDADGYKSKNGMNVYDQTSRADLTEFCEMFVSSLRDAGYKSGVYANSNYFNSVLYRDKLLNTKGYHEWRAHWGVNESPVNSTCWQFGAVGICGKELDGDIWYGDSDETEEENIPNIEPHDYSHIYQNQIDDSVVFTYQAQINGSQWLPPVANDSDYAGIYGTPITGIAVSVNKGWCEYRVHTGGRWLAYIESDQTNILDYANGYAGNGKAIDAIEIYYHTPDDISGRYGYKVASYHVQQVDRWGYFPWQNDNQTTKGQDGYAGSFGRNIDAIQIVPNAA